MKLDLLFKETGDQQYADRAAKIRNNVKAEKEYEAEQKMKKEQQKEKMMEEYQRVADKQKKDHPRRFHL